ncbi:MAG: hypothetical protein AB4352_25640 [Hormoscilla sp.]
MIRRSSAGLRWFAAFILRLQERSLPAQAKIPERGDRFSRSQI